MRRGLLAGVALAAVALAPPVTGAVQDAARAELVLRKGVAARAPLGGAAGHAPARPEQTTADASLRGGGSLQLAHGVQYEGELVVLEDGRLGWATPGFLAPLELALEHVERLSLPRPEDSPASTAALRLELVNGDQLLGEVADLGEDHVDFESSRLGRVRVPHARILGLWPRQSEATLHDGAPMATEWIEDLDRKGFRVEANTLVLYRSERLARRDLRLDEPVTVELQLSWEAAAPQFRVFVGQGEDDADERCVIVEPWDDRLVAYRELDDGIEHITLQEGLASDGDLTLRMRVDSERVAFTDSGGAEVGSVSRGGTTGPFLTLQHLEGLTRLHSVRALRWGGGGPISGPVRIGEVAAYDAVASTFTLQGGEVLGTDTLPGVIFGGSTVGSSEGWSLDFVDGERISGPQAEAAAGAISLSVSWSDQPVMCPVDGLFEARSTVARGLVREPVTKLMAKHVEGRGTVVGLEGGGLQWTPTGFRTGAPLDLADPMVLSLHRQSSFLAPRRRFPHRIQLANGRRIPCRVRSIEAGKVVVDTPFLDDPLTLNEVDVKAVELDHKRMVDLMWYLSLGKPQAATEALSRGGRPTSSDESFLSLERLKFVLSVPRKSKRDPGTHVLVGHNGDVLRGRLLRVTDKEVALEGRRGQQRVFPVSRVSAIVRVDFEDAEPDPSVPAPLVDPEGSLVIALDDEVRLAGRLLGMTRHELHIESAFFGELILDTDHVLALINGEEKDPPANLYRTWVLTPMIEPFPDAAAGPEVSPPSVGSQAPEIEGQDLDGETFRLSDYRGKVVLLDFWGHW